MYLGDIVIIFNFNFTKQIKYVLNILSSKIVKRDMCIGFSQYIQCLYKYIFVQKDQSDHFIFMCTYYTRILGFRQRILYFHYLLSHFSISPSSSKSKKKKIKNITLYYTISFFKVRGCSSTLVNIILCHYNMIFNQLFIKFIQAHARR